MSFAYMYVCILLEIVIFFYYMDSGDQAQDQGLGFESRVFHVNEVRYY